MTFTHTVDAAAASARLHVAGELDQTTSAALEAAASELLAKHPRLRDLRLDFTGLDFCNSAGLSAILQVHRLVSAASVRLHLDHTPAHLARVLDITGILEYLTAAPDAAADESDIG